MIENLVGLASHIHEGIFWSASLMQMQEVGSTISRRLRPCWSAEGCGLQRLLFDTTHTTPRQSSGGDRAVLRYRIISA
jgi:hypothetical protein